MPTVRENIWADIEQALKGISDIKTVEMHKSSLIDLDKISLPAAFVYLDSDKGEEGNKYEQWTLGILVEVWAKNDKLEDLLGKAHQAMYQDRTRDGWAEATVRTGSSVFRDITPDRSIGAVWVNFEVTYRHLVGDPYTQ